MPIFEVTDPNTGQTLELEGDTPPSEAELEQIFAAQAQQGQTAQPAPQSGNLAPQAPPGGQPAPTEEGGGIVSTIDKGIARIAEPALTFGSAVLAEPIAGLAGLFQTINPFADPGAGARAVEGTREALTVQPFSEEGKIGLQAVAEFGPVKGFVDILEASEQGLGDLGFEIAGPLGGAFGASIPTIILEGLGLVSLKKLRVGKADLIDSATGKPKPELQKALDDAGVDFNDLTPQQRADLSGLKLGASEAEAARKARFEEQGIPFTKGDVAQDFPQISREQRLLSMIGDEASEPLRQLKFQQSEAFIRNVDEVVDSLGGTKEAGETLKGALEGRLKLLKKEKTDLYKQFSETSPELKSIPIITDDIVGALPDKQTTRRIQRLVPTQGKALDELLVEFGIDQTPAKVDEFIKAGNDITPLDIGNFEDFRVGINAIERADQTGAIKVLTGPVKKALDNEAGLIDDAARGAGITDESLLQPLKQARKTVRQIKTEFSPDSITGKLIKIKKDGVTPLIEASKVVDKVIGPNVPIENLQRTLESLKKSGANGAKAIKSLQASVLFKALDDALGAPTRKTGGIETVGGNAFDKSLRKFGDDRLNLLFADDPATLKKIKGLQKTAKDITPPSAATPKGSAAIILDALKNFGRLPGAAAVVDATKFLVKAGADDRAVARAVKARPGFSRSLKLIKAEYPDLAFALGIAGVDEPLKKEGQTLTIEQGAE